MRCRCALFIAIVFSFCSHLLMAVEFIPSQFEVKFEQKIIALDNKEKITKGTLKYRFPGQIRMEISEPEGQRMTFVSNKEQSWHYTPPFIEGEKGEGIVEKSNQKLISGLFDVLRQGLKNNEHYKVKAIKGLTEISFLKPTQDKLGMDHVELQFKGPKNDSLAEVKELKIYYVGDDQKDVTFLFTVFNGEVKLDDKVFIYEFPVGTNITKK